MVDVDDSTKVYKIGGVSKKVRYNDFWPNYSDRYVAIVLPEKIMVCLLYTSGGQCQRVAIARAIIGNPEIILADEPTGNLDSKMGAEVMELLHRLNKEDGRTIVMVTHNEEQAKQTSRTIRFFDGRQVQ